MNSKICSEGIFRLEQAIVYATGCHIGQLRKGSDMPYIVHPLEVMNILRSMGADTDLLIAGLLHDTVEDTGSTEEDIRRIFGDEVAALVMAHTDDKSLPWPERKARAVAELAVAPHRVRMLIMADKLSNLRSMAADCAAIGDRLWERFAAPYELQRQYYSAGMDALRDMVHEPRCAAVYAEMQEHFNFVFGDKKGT